MGFRNNKLFTNTDDTTEENSSFDDLLRWVEKEPAF